MNPYTLMDMADEATPRWEAVKSRVGKSEFAYLKLYFDDVHSFTTFMHSEANARLAALAPDMARILSDLVRSVERLDRSLPPWVDSPERQAVREALREFEEM